MSIVRNPNCGPYVVSWVGFGAAEQEVQTWADACRLMRELLVSGFTRVSVRFV